MRITVYEQNPCLTLSGYCLEIGKDEQNPSFAFPGYYGIYERPKRPQ